jgi:hypothetical protein
MLEKNSHHPPSRFGEFGGDAFGLPVLGQRRQRSGLKRVGVPEWRGALFFDAAGLLVTALRQTRVVHRAARSRIWRGSYD